jgi:cytochrome c-type biogenesis protein CcmH/NrfF
VDSARTIALLIHPMLALILIFWMIKQYGWKKQSRELKGEERLAVREKHERNGEILVWGAITVAIMGFVGRMIAGWVTNRDITSEIMPQSLHGWTGPLGVILLWTMARWGRFARNSRESGESFHVTKSKHSRAADLIVALMAIHAFLGFLYVFSVL